MDIIIYGLISGSIILLSAIGFSMTLKTEGFLNISHGQMLLLGAYFGLFYSQLGIIFPIAAFLSIFTCGILGIAIHRIFYEPIKSKGNLILLFTSVGIAYIINGLVGAIAGKRMLAFDLPVVRVLKVGTYNLLTIYELIVVIASLMAVIGLHIFLTYSKAGKNIRAVADNPELSKVRGIDPKRCSDIVWFIASSLAGLAGIFLGLIGSIHLEMGWQQTVIILAATVLGGLGSIYGVMLAAIILGLGMEIGLMFFSSSYRTGIAFGIIIIVLLIRPNGLQSLWGKGSLRRE